MFSNKKTHSCNDCYYYHEKQGYNEDWCSGEPFKSSFFNVYNNHFALIYKNLDGLCKEWKPNPYYLLKQQWNKPLKKWWQFWR